jgi:hypothetical protein
MLPAIPAVWQTGYQKHWSKARKLSLRKKENGLRDEVKNRLAIHAVGATQGAK